MKAPLLRSCRLQNFKAIRDSGRVRLGPLTAFIGNNGSGKSSLIEGLETIQAIGDLGLDRAMQQWRGFEHVLNQSRDATRRRHSGERPYPHPMHFSLQGSVERGPFTANIEINMGPGGNEIFIQQERVTVHNQSRLERDTHGTTNIWRLEELSDVIQATDGESMLDRGLDGLIARWQFVSLAPQMMGAPAPQKRTGGQVRLAKDGSNIAEYLLGIRTLDPDAFNGIVDTLQWILPYSSDLQPTITSELERAVYLQLTEGTYKVPGWLLSTGTLRLLALLALFRHPNPPPLIVIEEIENGLDPRTVGLLIEELRSVVQAGATQVILTTHSPYLLDLLSLEHIVLVERVEGQPVFSRPADQASLQEWATNFSPGRLYTMGKLGRAGDA